jgi:hypothetical protein
LRRLTGLEHLDHEFATTWRLYDLDPKTRALLEYTKKLTETPGAVGNADFDALGPALIRTSDARRACRGTARRFSGAKNRNFNDNGGRRGFRTPDLQHVKLALSQLS